MKNDIDSKLQKLAAGDFSAKLKAYSQKKIVGDVPAALLSCEAIGKARDRRRGF